MSADEAIGKLDSSMRVGLPPGCGEPRALTEALVRNARSFRGLTLVGGLLLTAYDFLREELAENFRFVTWHVMPAIREAVRSGRVEFLPIRYSEVIAFLSQNGPWAVDAMLIQTSPPDAHGYLSLGPSVSYPLPVARQAPLVIAEVNAQCPRTLGDSSIHMDKVDWLVESARPPVTYGTPKVGDIERKIASHVAELIPDGATLQIGIGSIPEAILECLPAKKDIGIHSMIVDNMIELVERGVITNRKKTLNPGKFDVTELMGSEKLWRFVHENPGVNMQPSSFTHDPRVIAQIKDFVSVNSAIEIDLMGQVNSESIGETQVSGIGGQF
ncbi:MAG: acetyl-CoA hydrolase/transferase family protein, partial [Vicinamibacteria bacterium]